MAVVPFNDSLNIRANKSIDDRTLKYGQSAWASIAEARAGIVKDYRHPGLTVLIKENSLNVEYWWKDGVEDHNLVRKTGGGTDLEKENSSTVRINLAPIEGTSTKKISAEVSISNTPNNRLTFDSEGLYVPPAEDVEIPGISDDPDNAISLDANGDWYVPTPILEVRAFDNLAALKATAVEYNADTIVSTKGFYTVNDGGQAQYIIRDTEVSGLLPNSPAQFPVPGGKFAYLYHTGSVNLKQFGAKGDNVTNDYPAFQFVNNFKKVDANLNTINGNPGSTYLLQKQARALANQGQTNFEIDCFIRIDYSGCTWDGRGSKIRRDCNSMQSRVYHTKGGKTHVYRCKISNVNQEPPQTTRSQNYWSSYHWEMIEEDVTPDGTYPTWNPAIQYYGAMDWCNIGWRQPGTGPKIENITWKNWDIDGCEPDAWALDAKMWNVKSKGFHIEFGYNNILYENIHLHHICSEMFYGGAELESGRQTVHRCKITKGHNAISGGGFPYYITENIIEDMAANAIENFTFSAKVVIRDNDVTRCYNGITVGGPGNDINVQGDVTITGNRIRECNVYGLFVAGKQRGVTITDNKFYDTGLSLYALSNSFPSVNSEVLVANNQFYVYKNNVSAFIELNSEHGNNNILTANILITNNSFGASEMTYIEGYNRSFTTCIYFTGTKYRNVSVQGNVVHKGLVSRFISYTNTGGWIPHMRNNTFTDYVATEPMVHSGVPAYNNPVVFNWTKIREDRSTLYFDDYVGHRVCFFSAGNFAGFPNSTHFDGITFTGTNGMAIVFVPGGKDNLTRAVFKYTQNGTYLAGYLNLIRPNRITDLTMRSWEYYFPQGTITIPNTLLYRKELTGTINPGQTVVFTTTGGYRFSHGWSGIPDYHQRVVDPDVANNIAANTADFTVQWYSVDIQVEFRITNNTDSIQSLAGKWVAYRVYTFGNLTYLPNVMQPLRTEGTTSLRPVGADVYNGFVFRDTSVNQYLQWDAKNAAWIPWTAPGSGGGGTTFNPKDSFTLNANGTRNIEGGKDLINIKVNPTAMLAAFKVGTAPGADDVVSEVAVTPGAEIFSVNMPFESTTTLYFSGITSATQITITSF